MRIQWLIPSLVLAGAASAQEAPEGNRAYTSSRGVPEYRIGPGDELRIQIWNGVEAREYEVTVQSDGNVFLPYVGLARLSASDRGPLELRDEILSRLAPSFREPSAEVIVTRKVARTATLLGEIRSTARLDTGPGRYPLPGRIRLVDFITEHGGVTPQSDLKNAQLIRDGKTSVLDLSRAVFQGDASQNPVMDDGDLVYVPPLSTSSRKFMVFGEVRTPGLLELPVGLNVAEAIARSGGFTNDAHRSGVVVVRGGLENPVLLTANFEAMKGGDLSQDFPLENGDMVFVGRRALSSFRDVVNTFAAPLSFIYTSLLIHQAAER